MSVRLTLQDRDSGRPDFSSCLASAAGRGGSFRRTRLVRFLPKIASSKWFSFSSVVSGSIARKYSRAIVRKFREPFLRPRFAGWYSLENLFPTSHIFALPITVFYSFPRLDTRYFDRLKRIDYSRYLLVSRWPIVVISDHCFSLARTTAISRLTWTNTR